MLPLGVMLERVRALLQAGPVTVEQLPADIVADWIARDGRARIQAFPRRELETDDGLWRFARAVQAVAPDATGVPISIRAAGDSVVAAFLQAGAWSFAAIVLILAAALRRVRDVVLTMVPVLLSGLLTFATSAVLDLPLNFANIIALPLLFGVGVAFNIYFVMAWRAGETAPLQSSLMRAVVFSALTTATAFGALWLSSHPGTASMGRLLMISLGWELLVTLLFRPALLAVPPRAGARDEGRRAVGHRWARLLPIGCRGGAADAGPSRRQMRPHRAEYTLRLGTALNATRIGSIVQDIELTCDGWRIRRELIVDASLTPSFKVSFTSRLEGDEPRGKGFTWRALQVLNGAEREVRGTVERKDGAWQVDRTTPDGPQQSVLPSLTHDARRGGGLAAAAAGGRKRVVPDARVRPRGRRRRLPARRETRRRGRRRHDAAVAAPRRGAGTQSWPFSMAVTRAGADRRQASDAKPS